VQALKFESAASETRSSRSTSSAISYDDSGLADFLVSRAVQNFVLGNSLYWYLVIELALQKDDRVMSKMYYKIMFKFQEQLELVSLYNA
jgi:phosphatidylinositol 3-kinase